MKKLYLLLLSMIVLMSISCAFASDNTNETMINRDVNVDETITANLENVYVDNTTVPTNIDGSNSVDNTNVTGTVDGTSSPKSFNDLKHTFENDIHSGDVFNFDADYKFDKEGQTGLLENRVIVINQDNITINGKGHTIDAGGLDNFAIFKVLGNNVTITNLKFINSIPDCSPRFLYTEYRNISSPISWMGNNGVMQNCVFFNNSAINGGSLSWIGNNGTIDYCVFINSTASGIGGAIYIGGTNNSLSNCLFAGAKSLLGDAIYLDRNRKNISFNNTTFLGPIDDNIIIDGSISNIDVDYLHYYQCLYAYGDIFTRQAYQVNLVPLLFKAMVMGGTNDYNGLFKYNVLYDNVTGDFTFNIIGHDELRKSSFNATPDCNLDFLKLVIYGDPFRQKISCDCDFDYLKSISIQSNITDLNQVFSEICHGNYEYNIAQLFTRYVSNGRDYDEVTRCKSFGLWFVQDTWPIPDKGSRFASLKTGLKIIFTNKLTIKDPYTWTTKKLDIYDSKVFDTITILGNGSTIARGYAKKDCECTCFEMENVDKMLIVDGLTIKGFNTAVICSRGTCYFNNVTFEDNIKDYVIDRDWGAAILNTGGAVFCTNCSFMHNIAKNGGAIFNQGYLFLDNCTFEGNIGYGVGNNVCVGKGGNVVVNGKDVMFGTDIVYFAKSMSTTETVLMGVLPSIVAFVAGFITGLVTWNPGIGMAVGSAVGAGLGTMSAFYINSRHYDVNFNRGLTCLFVIGGATVAGAIGGYAGSSVMFQAHKLAYQSISTAEDLSEISAFGGLDNLILSFSRPEYLACDVHGKVTIFKNVFGYMLFDMPVVYAPKTVYVPVVA